MMKTGYGFWLALGCAGLGLAAILTGQGDFAALCVVVTFAVLAFSPICVHPGSHE